METETITRECTKCQGAGTLTAYAHVANGACFDCMGRGVLVTTAKREAARKAAAKRREGKRAQAADDFVANRMRSYLEAGRTLADYHADSCSCGAAGEGCTRTWNDGATGRQWDSLAG